MEVLHQFVCRTAEKMISTAIIAAAALVLLAGWFFVNDRATVQSRQRLLESRRSVEAQLTVLQSRIDVLAVEVAAQEQQVMASEKAMHDRQQLKSTWEWFGVNRAQVHANRELLEKMAAQHETEAAALGALRHELQQAKWDRDGLVVDRDRVEAQLRGEPGVATGDGYRLGRLWFHLRGWVCLGLALYLIGPVLIPAARQRWRRRRMAAI